MPNNTHIKQRDIDDFHEVWLGAMRSLIALRRSARVIHQDLHDRIQTRISTAWRELHAAMFDTEEFITLRFGGNDGNA